MKYIIAGLAFVLMLLSNAAFSFNWGGGNNIIYLIDGNEKYSYGELYYQLGSAVGYLLLFLAVRWDAKNWIVRLIFNWIIELYLICILFIVYSNPYSMNWDKILLLQISLAGMVILYLTCYLFPVARKVII